MVDATITPRMCNSLFKVKKPAKVKITSDGIGGKYFQEQSAVQLPSNRID